MRLTLGAGLQHPSAVPELEDLLDLALSALESGDIVEPEESSPTGRVITLTGEGRRFVESGEEFEFWN